MTTAASLLKHLDENILDCKGHWTTAAMARIQNGHMVSHNDSRAHSFCLYGGLLRAEKDLQASETVYYEALDRLFECLPWSTTLLRGCSLQKFNDCATTTFEDVKNVIKCAQAKAQEEAA
jgi:hypothetical protein